MEVHTKQHSKRYFSGEWILANDILFSTFAAHVRSHSMLNDGHSRLPAGSGQASDPAAAASYRPCTMRSCLLRALVVPKRLLQMLQTVRPRCSGMWLLSASRLP